MTREEAIDVLENTAILCSSEVDIDGAIRMAIEALKAELCENKGEISDGYHTFNQLYHQRAVLFATIVNQNKSRSWKSYKHSDGQYCFDSNGEWFIVGIDTPQGTYTYHYSKEYWNMFDCQELEYGKKWDGHTEEDVIRLLSLQQEPCEDAVSRDYVLGRYKEYCNTNCQFSQKQRAIMCSSCMMGDAIMMVEDAPSVQPERARGEWINGNCSNCGNHAPYWSMSSAYYRSNFCPNCGADLRGDKNVNE